MSGDDDDEQVRQSVFYGTQYARFGSSLAAEVRSEAYGEDIGQQGWRTAAEHREIIALLKEAPDAHLLDVACGSGGPSLALVTQTNCRLTGLDIEETAVIEARKRAFDMGLAKRASFDVGDCSRQLPYDPRSFDVIACIDAILHLGDRSAVFAEWHRLLADRGHLVLTDAAVITGPLSKAELDIRASQGPFQIVPPGTNEMMLEQAGFVLRTHRDTTAELEQIASGLHSARRARSEALQIAEGRDWFVTRQTFLLIVAQLAASRRLSRYLYIVEKRST